MAASMNGGASASASSAVDATAAKLLNFAEPLDVSLLDTTVDAFYGAGTNEQVCVCACVFNNLFVYLKTSFRNVRSRSHDP